MPIAHAIAHHEEVRRASDVQVVTHVQRELEAELGIAFGCHASELLVMRVRCAIVREMERDSQVTPQHLGTLRRRTRVSSFLMSGLPLYAGSAIKKVEVRLSSGCCTSRWAMLTGA